MSREEISALVTDPAGGVLLDGKVSCNNWKMIDTALSGALISGAALPTSRPGVTTMLYTRPPRQRRCEAFFAVQSRRFLCFVLMRYG